MKSRNKKIWTKTENDLLLEYYYSLSERALCDILPGRSPKEMQAQMHYVSRKNYKDYNESK